VHNQIFRDFAFIRVRKIQHEHVSFKIVEDIHFWEELFIPVGVRQARYCHELVVECSDPIHPSDRPVV
jgi:hypothetical protein